MVHAVLIYLNVITIHDTFNVRIIRLVSVIKQQCSISISKWIFEVHYSRTILCNIYGYLNSLNFTDEIWIWIPNNKLLYLFPENNNFCYRFWHLLQKMFPYIIRVCIPTSYYKDNDSSFQLFKKYTFFKMCLHYMVSVKVYIIQLLLL